jgi:predicted Rossmann-fold nucleotide-binding protein
MANNIIIAVGHAIAAANRPLVYGGGSKGLMGAVSGAALERGGKVTGVVPYAMVAAGGEQEKGEAVVTVELNEAGREKVCLFLITPRLSCYSPLSICEIEHIVVDSMHERKVEMAKRVAAFFGLPGGFGTFEEVI